MIRLPLLLVLLLNLSGCLPGDHYRIDCCNLNPDSKDHNTIYDIIENLEDSTSLQARKDTAMLKRFLKPQELVNAFDISALVTKLDTVKYYRNELIPIETLFKTDKYDAELILLMNKAERHYCFQIRTFSESGQLIAEHNFALYSDSLKEYYSGDLNIFSKTFTLEWYDKMEKYKFDAYGHIAKVE